jgi:hypothetical protein
MISVRVSTPLGKVWQADPRIAFLQHQPDYPPRNLNRVNGHPAMAGFFSQKKYLYPADGIRL